jgi:predicted metal-dependent phosphoesterase TrpH
VLSASDVTSRSEHHHDRPVGEFGACVVRRSRAQIAVKGGELVSYQAIDDHFRGGAGSVAMIRVDLHVHTSYSVDGIMSPEEVVDVSLRRGLGALAITDHNSVAGAQAVQQLAPFPVVIGQEISTSDGEIVGLFLEQEVPKDLSAGETVRLIKEQGALAGVPHPFDRLRRESLDGGVLEGLADRLDFLEVFNARVTLPEDNRRAREFALRQGLASTAGSDAHSRFELGRVYVEMPSFDGREEFLERLREGRIVGAQSPFWVHFCSISARALRNLRRG